MLKEGCMIPVLFLVFSFGWLILEGIAKDETTVFVNFSQYPDQTFSLSELTLEKLEEQDSLKLKCGDQFFSIDSKDVAQITGNFEFSEDEVINCDRL
ncbi:hypothetical protein [Crocosphaera chwakensis]|uniref:Uncharacterized protein n=1 Tax=Crocosphaera chwakensis CCY0110 TaxID=391612 RepID=A3IZ54_9CHRO|nr:hypothetical protein [Crocosphaera chwakensis]EAZ88258.1 hypothetical protein CY0110_14515 [Crocosphaera chwakensis CCY0110]